MVLEHCINHKYRMYCQYSPDCLSTCPVTIHGLLHITDSIEALGPMWAYWAFPMEHYCSSLTPAVCSRCFPFPSIDRYITEQAQLTHIKMFHSLHNILSLQSAKHDVVGFFSDPACKYFNIKITEQLLILVDRSNMHVTPSM